MSAEGYQQSPEFELHQRLVAEYDGCHFSKRRSVTRGVTVYSRSSLKYHKSWDWQIPVWKKLIPELINVAIKTGYYANNRIEMFRIEYHHIIDSKTPLEGFDCLARMIIILHDLKSKL